ncbi:MAG TPA: arylsulfotransferase family protein [Albidovulum sp.]|uniref:arylsulfotransferase family protein n=1 Tax=Albidovulum sp. TaxID=1872424 RepID=UPI002CC24726|nr:arylsulfotransferase family protein [Albidovulum sp.]
MRLASRYERNYPKIAWTIGVIGLSGVAFLAGYVKGSPRDAGSLFSDLTAQAAETLAAAWDQTAGVEPTHFLQPSRQPGAGVTVNTAPASDDLILLTGFFGDNPGLRLLRRDGSIVAAWPAAFSRLLPERVGKSGAPETDWNIDLHGSYIEPDGSVLFNFEYQGAVKLDRCGARLWALPERMHHSIEPAASGGYWMGGLRVEPDPNAPAYRPIVSPDREQGRIDDDLILRVGENGRILQQKSVFRILMDNGLEPLLSATGNSLDVGTFADSELLHLNMIAELPSALAPAFPEFRAGDLVVSIRDYNLVFVVDPTTWKVKWHSTGPWLRQHSAQFLQDGTIGVFNNNAYDYQSDPDGVTDLSQPRRSQILSVDPKSAASLVRYGTRPGQEMMSVVRGYIQPLPDGGFLITEPDAGRALQIDGEGRTVWEYINRFDADRVLEMTGARVFPAGYFTVKDWSCP